MSRLNVCVQCEQSGTESRAMSVQLLNVGDPSRPGRIVGNSSTIPVNGVSA
jgi:hypothetical protein